MTLCNMIFSLDFPDPDECLKYHVQDKAPLFENCGKKHGVQCINGKYQAYSMEMSGSIYKDKEKVA